MYEVLIRSAAVTILNVGKRQLKSMLIHTCPTDWQRMSRTHFKGGNVAPTYKFVFGIAQIIHRTHLPNKGDEIHHTGWNACSRCIA